MNVENLQGEMDMNGARGSGIQRWALLFWITLAALFVAVGCGTTITPERVSNKPVAPSGGEATKVKPPETFRVGDTVRMGQLTITVHGKRLLRGGQFLAPEAGNVWVVVEATIGNAGDEPVSISTLLMFTLADSHGYNYTPVVFGPKLKGELDAEIAPGRKIRGEVAFEVPGDAKGLELIFAPNILGFGQAIFRLDQ